MLEAAPPLLPHVSRFAWAADDPRSCPSHLSTGGGFSVRAQRSLRIRRPWRRAHVPTVTPGQPSSPAAAATGIASSRAIPVSMLLDPLAGHAEQVRGLGDADQVRHGSHPAGVEFRLGHYPTQIRI